jgi:hypothetical protein|tara:strand:+ start:154 stop:621 length:468 start_codon:yes stop_codon:yes gene_type:complete
MLYKTGTGRTLIIDQSFTLNGEKFPSNWLRVHHNNTEELEKRGITLAESPESDFKPAKWYVNRIDEEGVVTSTPIELDAIKKRETASVRSAANGLLADTDWMVVRQAESGKAVPTEWTDYRAAVRTASDEAEEAINAADFEGIQKLKCEWPKRPE